MVWDYLPLSFDAPGTKDKDNQLISFWGPLFKETGMITTSNRLYDVQDSIFSMDPLDWPTTGGTLTFHPTEKRTEGETLVQGLVIVPRLIHSWN